MDESTSRVSLLTQFAGARTVSTTIQGRVWELRAPSLGVLGEIESLEGNQFERLARMVWLIGRGSTERPGAEGWLDAYPTWQAFAASADVTDIGELNRVCFEFLPWVRAVVERMEAVEQAVLEASSGDGRAPAPAGDGGAPF